MKTSLIIVVLFVSGSLFSLSCSSPKTAVDKIVNQYLQDSIIPRMNDPKSFELVGMSYDSTFDHHFYQMELEDDSIQLDAINSTPKLSGEDSSTMEEYRKNRKKMGMQSEVTDVKALKDSIYAYRSYLQKPDSIHTITVGIEFRGKNVFGALVINKVKLKYDRRSNSIINSWQVNN